MRAAPNWLVWTATAVLGGAMGIGFYGGVEALRLPGPVAALTSIAGPEPPDCIFPFSLTGDGASATFDNRQKGCFDWFAYMTATGFATCTLDLRSASDTTGGPGSFSSFNSVGGGGLLIRGGSNPFGCQGSNPTNFINVQGVRPYIRVEQTGTTGTGTFQGVVYGYRARPRDSSPLVSTYNTAVISNASAASKDYLTLFNAVGSGRVLRIARIGVVAAPTAAITGLVAAVTVSKVSTAGTTCTTVTMNALDTDNLPLPAQVTSNNNCSTDATVTFDLFGCTALTEETTANGPYPCYLAPYNPGSPLVTGEQPITLREGQGIMVKGTALAPAGPISANIIFTALTQ